MKVCATDADNDKLTYYLYVGGSRKATATNVTSGTTKYLTAGGLSEYTYYDWYVEVTDGNSVNGTTYSGTYNNRTKCSGGYYSYETTECTTRYDCGGGDSVPIYGACTNGCTNGLLTCDGQGTTSISNGGRQGLTCPSCGFDTYAEYREFHCSRCGADGFAEAGCIRESCELYHMVKSHIHPTTYDCPNCNGGQMVTGYSHTQCSHGVTYSHTYCSHYDVNPPYHTYEKSVWHQCVHNQDNPH